MKREVGISYATIIMLRVFLSGIFIIASFNHFLRLDWIIGRMEASPFAGFVATFGSFKALALVFGSLMLVATLAFVLGLYTRYAAMALLILLIPMTVMIHTHNGILHGQLWKDIALMGGMLFFILNPSLAGSRIKRGRIVAGPERKKA